MLLFILFIAAAGLCQVLLQILNLYSLERWYRLANDPAQERLYCYQKTLQQYTLANRSLETALLLLALALNWPAWLFSQLGHWLPNSAPILHGVLFLLVLQTLLSLWQLPWSSYRRFVIEERFGFNQMSPRDYLQDLLRSSILGLALGLPLLTGIFWLMLHLSWWWLWAFLVLTAYQILLVWLYPVFIAPLFNRFIPLENGPLRQRLEAVLAQCHFSVKGLFVMDGSRRSCHSNAYFTGLGKSRRIVLFDTLVQDLEQEPLASVLAHEVGHYQRKHILKMVVQGIVETFLGFLALYLLVQWHSLFVNSFPLPQSIDAPNPGIVIFVALIASIPLALPLQFLRNYFSRKHEFEADAYANRVLGSSQPLREALLALHRENLSNPAPHRCYTAFYYSHPSLAERLAAMPDRTQ